MVLTIPVYDPLMRVSDKAPGGFADSPTGSGIVRFNVRVLTRYGEVVIDFGDFGDLINYQDSLSVEGAASNFTLRMKATADNEELLKKIHPGYVIEVYCARNDNPLIGVVRDPSRIKRVDTTPDLSVIPSVSPVTTGTTEGAIAPGVSSTLASVDQFFVGGSNSFAARAIGHSEGNRTADGGFNASYRGHTDPGNSAYNVGSFSVQGRGRLTPEQADQNQLQELRNQMPRYVEACQAAGLNPNDLRLLTNFTDLHTQSPRAARNFLNRLSRLNGNTSYDSILNLRVGAYDGRSTLGSRLPADQGRRMRALETVITSSGGAIASTSTAAAPAAPVAAPAPAAPAATPVTQTQQTQRYSTTLASQRYGASRGGGSRRHAGVDLDISGGDATAISFIGGVCTFIGSNPGGYWDYLDIWNAELGVVERIAEYKNPIGIRVGDRVAPGQAVGRGEISCGSVARGQSCGVIHYEIRPTGLIDAAGGKRGGTGFQGTVDPTNYLRGLGIDPYAAPDNVFKNARITPPLGGFAGGIPTAGAGVSAEVPIVAVEGVVVEPVEDYYLDKCPYLLLHGVICDYGRSTSNGQTSLTLSGEGYGKIYKDCFILLDQSSPSTLGQAFEIRSQAQVITAVSYIYYQVLKNWVESFWGEETGWEARTRPIPLPPNYLARISEGSAWSSLQYLSIDGFFHLFVDHTGALVWEKLPWSSQDQSLIDGRCWEKLPLIDLPSWKIISWNDRLSEQGVTNFLRVIPTMQGQSGGQEAVGLAGMIYNMGSIRQYGGPTKRELQVPYGSAGDQWYTSALRREAQAQFNTFADLCVLEGIRWFDRPVQRVNVNVRGEAAWRIGTRLSLTENWHSLTAKPGEYYVSSRSHSIDVAQGSWTTQLSLVRDRRNRYLGIGVGEVPIITDQLQVGTTELALSTGGRVVDNSRFTQSEDFSFANVQLTRYEAPNENSATGVAEKVDIKVPLVPDEYYWFDRRQNRVIPIGNDPIAFADKTIIPALGQVQTTGVNPPQTPTDQTNPTAAGAKFEPAEVEAPQLENSRPAGSYTFALERDGKRDTPIPSPINGTVVRSAYLDDYGHVVEVRGSDGRSWLMAHLDSRAVQVGQTVQRGQALGNQGESGRAETPHVLLEIRTQSGGRSSIITDRSVTRPLVDEYLEFVRAGNE
jgi:murein DD-endopeptidase MepM/ murein hydrolase activator NlpD